MHLLQQQLMKELRRKDHVHGPFIACLLRPRLQISSIFISLSPTQSIIRMPNNRHKPTTHDTRRDHHCHVSFQECQSNHHTISGLSISSSLFGCSLRSTIDRRLHFSAHKRVVCFCSLSRSTLSRTMSLWRLWRGRQRIPTCFAASSTPPSRYMPEPGWYQQV